MEKELKLKTKNYNLYFILYFYINSWALPLGICIEYFSKNYMEVQIRFLFLTFEFVGISKEHLKKLDKLVEEYSDEKKTI